MRLLTRPAEPQEPSDDGFHDGPSGRKGGLVWAASVRGIAAGSRVAVLDGRHFSAFGSGDEGVVLSVDAEALNCRVQFEGRPRPVPVALRHLRLVAEASEEPQEELLPSQSHPGFESFEATQESTDPITESCLVEDGFSAGAPARGPSAVPTPKLAEPVAGDDLFRRGHISSRPTRAASLPPRSAAGFSASAPQLHPASSSTASGSTAAASGPGMADIVLQSSQSSRLDALEARLADMEELHRHEVASLRHALKECVSAINACSRVVNVMCVAASETSTEWERTAAALQHATSLGTRVLDGAGHGGAVGSSAAVRVPVECTAASPAAGGGGAARCATGVLAPGSLAVPAAEPGVDSAVARRYLVATVQPQSPRAFVPQQPMMAHHPVLQSIPPTPHSAAAPAVTQVVHTQTLQGPPMLMPGWQGPWAAPPSPTGGEHGPGPPQHLAPPAGLTFFGGLGAMPAGAHAGYGGFCPGA